METFKDRTGETWDLDLNIGVAMRLKSRLDFDLEYILDIQSDLSVKDKDKTPLEKLATDAIFMFNVIFVTCEKQCRERNLSEEEFAERFSAETIIAATDALIREIVNFSRPQKRKVLEKLLRINSDLSEKMGAKLDQILEDPEFEKMISEEVEKSISLN